MDGRKCSECEKLGKVKHLKYFHVNLMEDILKCESDTCDFPFPKIILRNTITGLITEMNPPNKGNQNQINGSEMDPHYDLSQILSFEPATTTGASPQTISNNAFLDENPIPGAEKFAFFEANPLEYGTTQSNSFLNLADRNNLLDSCSDITFGIKSAADETDDLVEHLISDFFQQEGAANFQTSSVNIENESLNFDLSSLNFCVMAGQKTDSQFATSENLTAPQSSESAKLSMVSNFQSIDMTKDKTKFDEDSDCKRTIRGFKMNQNLQFNTRKLVPEQTKPRDKCENSVKYSNYSKESKDSSMSPRKFKFPKVSNDLNVKHADGKIKITTKKQKALKQKKDINAILNAPDVKEIRKPLDLVKYIQSLEFPKK